MPVFMVMFTAIHSTHSSYIRMTNTMIILIVSGGSIPYVVTSTLM